MIDLTSDFYAFLSTQHFQPNQNGQYNFNLPRPLQFNINENWECGIKKIIFPSNVANNSNCKLNVHDLTNHSISTFQVGERPNRYTAAAFESALNNIQSKEHIPGKFKFAYAIKDKKYSLEISDDLVGISFNSTLASKLGFESGQIYKGIKKWRGVFRQQINFGCQTLSIFSNLIQASIFGNREDYILETVSLPITESSNDLSYHTFKIGKPNYLKVVQSYVENIMATILHEDDSPVNLYGTTVACPIIIVLHFRRGIIV